MCRDSAASQEVVIGVHSWVVVADSPFLPARGGGEREHLGFVRAARDAGRLGVLVVPSSERLDLEAYRAEAGSASVLTTRRRENPALLLSPTTPYVVASRPPRRTLVDDVRRSAVDAPTGVVVFSYKSWRIGQALATGLGLPAVLRQHNLEGPYHRSLAAGTPGPRGLVLRVEAARIDRDERRLERADWLGPVADISATDAAVRRDRGAQAVHVPPFAWDETLVQLPRDPGPEPRALFLGALDVATNTDALAWLLDRVWPSVRERLPEATLDVVGRRPSAALTSRLQAAPGVELHADVPEILPFLARARLALNPAVSGSGVNIKLVDYLQAGVPVVSTTLGSQGLGLGDGDGVSVRDAPADFAAAVADLLAEPDRAESLGRLGRSRAVELLAPQANLGRLATLLER